MRIVVGMMVACCLTAYSAAAERAQSKTAPKTALPLWLVQLAPDGFPLRFPQIPLTTPALRPAAAPATEELPLPAGPSILAPIPAVPPPSVSLPAVPVRYPTHREFAASFHPAPGNYEVMMLHPYTHCPVKVCFSLPPGCIRKVAADRNELRFNYGKWELEVHFKRDGRVTLDIDD